MADQQPRDDRYAPLPDLVVRRGQEDLALLRAQQPQVSQLAGGRPYATVLGEYEADRVGRPYAADLEEYQVDRECQVDMDYHLVQMGRANAPQPPPPGTPADAAEGRSRRARLVQEGADLEARQAASAPGAAANARTPQVRPCTPQQPRSQQPPLPRRVRSWPGRGA